MLNDLTEAIVAKNPLHADFLNASLAGMSEDARQSLEEYVTYSLSRGRSIEYLVDCYNTIVNDMLAEQYYFYKHGSYRYSRFEDVASSVYFDDDYMSRYMWGLALSMFLWPNHARMLEFFIQTFPAGKRGTYLEVGPGHGYYLRRAAELGDFDRIVGVDISPTSVAMTRDILQYHGVGPKAEIVLGDFVQFASEKQAYSCIVMGEVLEHVEHPERFLEAVAEASDRDTHVFITTCANAPAVDHIYLFRSPEEVETLIDRCGFDVVDRCYVPYAGKSLEESRKASLAINVAYVLRKR